MTDVMEVVEGRNCDELQALIDAATAAQASAKQRAIEEFESAVESIKAKAEALGLNVKSYLVEKKEYPAKYRNPANETETWNGRGPRPAWLRALLADVPAEQIKEAQKQYLIES